MRISASPTPLRCALVWLAATAVAAATVWWVLPDLVEAASALGEQRAATEPFERWLAWVSAAALAGCAAWAWYVVTVVVLEAARGLPAHRPARPGVPVWARRLVLAACGAAVAGALAPAAHAAPLDPSPAAADRGERAERADRWLDGLPLPERAEGRSVAQVVAERLVRQQSAPAPLARPAPSQPEQTHRVGPGESLWSIASSAWAAGHDGATPSDAQVASYWPLVHAANRDAVPDPDLIRPGQSLELPPPPDLSSDLGEDPR